MTEFVILAAILALVWGGLFVLRGSLVVGCLGVLLSVCCFGYEFFHSEPSITIDRILLVVVVATYFAQRGLRLTDPKPLAAVDYVTFGFVAYLLISMLCSDFLGLPKKQISPTWRWFGGYLTPALLYWAAKQAPWTERTAKIVQGSLAVFGIYLGFTAVCEITRQWAFVFPAYIANPEVGLHFGRARGPMVHGVSFGDWQGVCLLAAWVCLLWTKPAWKIPLLLTWPLFFAGVFFSYTRSVWMGTGLGLMIVLFLTLRGRTRNIVLGGLALSAILVGLTQMDKIVGFQREQSAADTRESADLRVSFAYVSWQMFLDRPIFGFGFGRFPLDKLPYLSDRSTNLRLEAIRPYVHHNTYLSLLTDTGIVGLGLFLTMFFLMGREAWRTYRSDLPDWRKRQAALFLGAVGVYAMQLLFHELSYTPIDNSLIFFLAGCAGAVAPQRSKESSPSHLATGLVPARPWFHAGTSPAAK